MSRAGRHGDGSHADSSGGAPVNFSEKLHRQITVTIWKWVVFFFKQKYSQHSDDIITMIKLWSLDCWHFLGLGSQFCVEEAGVGRTHIYTNPGKRQS